MDKFAKYEIVKELGRGATSTVYLAIDPFNQQQVALKVFNLDVLHDTTRAKAFRKLLLTEASLAGKLSHPHIVKIYDAVVDGERELHGDGVRARAARWSSTARSITCCCAGAHARDHLQMLQGAGLRAIPAA